jgi:hypothetical protein
MKKLVFISLVILLPVIYPFKIYGQCTPDTIGCVDTLLPGEVCPDSLPHGETGVEYNQTVTIRPPSVFNFGEDSITIVKIHIISIDSLPAGLEYAVNAEDLYPDTAYCALISGTPTDTGLFHLVVKVQPYIEVLAGLHPYSACRPPNRHPATRGNQFCSGTWYSYLLHRINSLFSYPCM